MKVPKKANVILVVDSDDSVRLQISNILKESGYIAIEASNAEVSACLQHSPDLVLLNSLMPAQAAYTCCKELCQLPPDLSIPVLMVVPLEDEDAVEQAFRCGAADCIPVSISRSLLVGRIERILKDFKQQRKQAQWEHIIWRITEGVRRYVNLQEIFQRTVTEVRDFLECERVLFYRVFSDGSGQVVAGAAVPNCPNLLGENIQDTCFRQNYLKLYRQGRLRIIDDTEKADLIPCYAELLKTYKVRANLVVPILEKDSFWGLIIAHNCTVPRDWKNSEVELLQHLSSHISLALNQAQHLETIEANLEKEKELSELKSRFFAMTSHDVRVPLSTIFTSSELLEQFGENYPQDKKIKHLQRIQASVKKVTRILDEAKLVIKDITSNLVFEPKPIDILSFCQNLFEDLQTSTNQNYRMHFKTKGDFSGAYMDGKLLEHILMNLLDNAIKYSPQGGDIVFELIREDNQAVFRVQDSGIGIPKGEEEKLLTYSYRASNVGNILGTGVGLAIVKNCVDLHGGKIKIDSEMGKGTTFTVTLPLTSKVLVNSV